MTLPNGKLGVDYYFAELARRDAEKQTKRMVALTALIFVFTLVVTVATIVNTIYVVAD